MSAYEHLILVPGHATFSQAVKPGQERIDLNDSQNWLLLPYQKGEAKYYMEHIRRGWDELIKFPQSVLIFCGGFTRTNSPQWSEAKSYWETLRVLCQEEGWDFEKHKKRIFTEERSTDSFQNLVCGMDKYYQIAGNQPENIKVVGWKFKKTRFEFHAKTLGWPKSIFEYIGVNNPKRLEEAIGAEARTLEKFKQNMAGGKPDKPTDRIWEVSLEMKKIVRRVVRASSGYPPRYAG